VGAPLSQKIRAILLAEILERVICSMVLAVVEQDLHAVAGRDLAAQMPASGRAIR
jgi:hypothetical protein